MILKIVVDAVSWAVLEESCSMQEAQNGMGWEAGARNIVFYEDVRRIAGRDHKWVQDSLTVTVSMFQRLGIEKNLYKTKEMVCTPGSYGGSGGSRPIRDRQWERGQP